MCFNVCVFFDVCSVYVYICELTMFTYICVYIVHTYDTHVRRTCAFI